MLHSASSLLLRLNKAWVAVVTFTLAAMHTTAFAAEHRPVFSPDGSQIIFMAQSSETADDWELYSMTIDGRNLRRLTDHPGWDGYAVWSPDGNSIVFDQGDAGENPKKTPILMNLKTGKSRPFGSFEGWLSVNDWHGENLLAFWDNGGQRDLFLLDDAGTIIQRLTNTPDQSEHDAHFSPDGTKVAFASGPSAGDGRTTLEMLDLVSGERTALKSSTGRIYGLDWSPDSQFVAFTDAPGGEDDDADIFVHRLKTDETLQCTDDDAWDHMPVWSAEGTTILFTSYRSGTEHMYLAACGEKPMRLWSGHPG